MAKPDVMKLKVKDPQGMTDPAYRKAVRATLVPNRFFKFIEKVRDGEWIVVMYDPFGGAEPAKYMLRDNGDLVRLGRKPLTTPDRERA